MQIDEIYLSSMIFRKQLIIFEIGKYPWIQYICGSYSSIKLAKKTGYNGQKLEKKRKKMSQICSKSAIINFLNFVPKNFTKTLI